MSTFNIGDRVRARKCHENTGTVKNPHERMSEMNSCIIELDGGLTVQFLNDWIELIPEPDGDEKEGS